MRQLLLLILLFFAGQWLVKALRRVGNAADAPRNGPFDTSARPDANPGNTGGAQAQSQSRQLAEPMVRCATCGVHTPQSESILAAGQRFCCAEHAERYAARPTGRTAR
ncbi:deaminase [Trinickia violacea]|uniref:Deaminase n=1 Tax=Trinickia violacea TaxID=2571746 RepID=A0A4P8IVE0_9BURK|nr:PP0621 family protein [Trinickia violacea]QCP51074.1 deaminase [Trinickia violacea]